MKKNLSAFMSGVLATTLVFGIGTSALAASGKLTITVDPINIQVNGQTFAPKDANGKPVDVFAYNGTTYAPLRALAEAYGLEVGYDAKTNMATVVDPDAPKNTPAPSTDYSEWSAEEEAAYQKFKGMWDVDQPNKDELHTTRHAIYNKNSLDDLKNFVDNYSEETMRVFCERFANEVIDKDRNLFLVYMYEKTGLWGHSAFDSPICEYRREGMKKQLEELSA